MMKHASATVAAGIFVFCLLTVLSFRFPAKVVAGDTWIYRSSPSPGKKRVTETNLVIAVNGEWITYSNAFGIQKANRHFFTVGSRRVNK